MKLSPKEATPKVRAAVEGDIDDKLYQLWLCYVPHMNKDNYVGFGEFKSSIKGENIDDRSAEEILAEAEEIKRRIFYAIYRFKDHSAGCTCCKRRT